MTAYTNPASEMRCSQCRRTGRPGERQGDTCGDPICKPFIPFDQTPESTIADMQRHSDKNMRIEHCLGTLLYPMLTD